MEQRNFGKSDLVSSAVGFGTWEMSTTQYGHIDVGEVSKAINLAIDRGIKWSDWRKLEVLNDKHKTHYRQPSVLLDDYRIVLDDKHDNLLLKELRRKLL